MNHTYEEDSHSAYFMLFPDLSHSFSPNSVKFVNITRCQVPQWTTMHSHTKLMKKYISDTTVRVSEQGRNRIHTNRKVNTSSVNTFIG